MTDKKQPHSIEARATFIALALIVFSYVLLQLMTWQYAVTVIGIAYLLFISLWKLPKWQLSSWKHRIDPKAELELKDFINAENSARATLAQIIGGVIVLVGLYYTSENLKNSQKTLEATQERQITESLTKAIDQLGSDKPDITIGGIYSLGRVARDSQRDHWSLMQVLFAYVQRVAPLKETEIGRIATLCDASELPEDGIIYETPSSNIQAVMDVLNNRKYEYEASQNQFVNISRSNLRRAYLQGARLENAHFIGDDMKGIALVDSHLEGARLNYSRLSFATLERAFFNRSQLIGTCLVRANLINAHLESANLTDADLRYAIMNELDLTRATLTRANLKGTDLSNVKGLKWEQIQAAQIDCDTQLPPDLEEHRQAEQTCK